MVHSTEDRPASDKLTGAIDCDVHPAVPNTRALLPYFDDYWREHILRRGLERESFETSSYPVNAPINGRPDWHLSLIHIYGLTFGLHTRIDETIARVTDRIQAGNIYINRNIIGATVGVQQMCIRDSPRCADPRQDRHRRLARASRPQHLAVRQCRNLGLGADRPADCNQ